MKSDHRHELKTNELADWLAHFPEWANQNRTNIIAVAVVLAVVFDLWYLAVVVVTIAIYIWFTFKVTEWRVKLRREMNDQDTDANQKAIDSVLNFETVKYFGAEAREAVGHGLAVAVGGAGDEAALASERGQALGGIGEGAGPARQRGHATQQSVDRLVHHAPSIAKRLR